MRTTRGHLNSINRFDINYVNLFACAFMFITCHTRNSKKGKKMFGISRIFDFTGENVICTTKMGEGGLEVQPKKYDENISRDHFILHLLYLIYTFAKVCMHSDAFVMFLQQNTFICFYIHTYIRFSMHQ